MSVDGFSNAYSTTLNGSIDNSQTTLVVTSTTGKPATTPFRLRIKAEGSNTTEIVTVTGTSSTTYTITRASEPYAGVQSASAHASGATVEQILTAGGLISISPDAPPLSPSAFDDEFNTTSTFSSTLGSLDSNNTTDSPGALHLAKTSPGTFQVHGVYKTAPSTPFTVTAKINWYLLSGNFQQYGIVIADSTPTALYVVGPTYQGTNGVPEVVYGKWTNRTTRGTIAEFTGNHYGLRYVRLVCTSSSSVDVAFSMDNQIWITMATAQNPGFTIANVGLFVTSNDNSVATNAYFDWIRFT